MAFGINANPWKKLGKPWFNRLLRHRLCVTHWFIWAGKLHIRINQWLPTVIVLRASGSSYGRAKRRMLKRSEVKSWIQRASRYCSNRSPWRLVSHSLLSLLPHPTDSNARQKVKHAVYQKVSQLNASPEFIFLVVNIINSIEKIWFMRNSATSIIMLQIKGELDRDCRAMTFKTTV